MAGFIDYIFAPFRYAIIDAEHDIADISFSFSSSFRIINSYAITPADAAISFWLPLPQSFRVSLRLRHFAFRRRYAHFRLAFFQIAFIFDIDFQAFHAISLSLFHFAITPLSLFDAMPPAFHFTLIFHFAFIISFSLFSPLILFSLLPHIEPYY
jgi:hypothetical protein